jgi:hypothetical protein
VSIFPITEGYMLTALTRIVVPIAATPVGGAPRCGGGAAPTADEAVKNRAPEAECWERTEAQTTGSRSEPDFNGE